MPTSDRCTVCGSPLAADQRYCVECGERRGAARFALPTPGTAAEPVMKSARVRRRPRMTPSATLIAGVGTLLLAMGIGVLIGDSGNASPQRSGTPAPVQVVTVGGGGGASTNASAVRTTGAKKTSTSSTSHKSSKKSKGTTTATTATAQSAPAPTVTIGAKGTGAGYQNGHFTGNFFGP
jgi:hypothetical protein